MDASSVRIVDWPAGEDERRLLAELGRPRLLRVASDAPPPIVSGIGEDWFREPCSAADIRARREALHERRFAIAPPPPSVDDADILRAGGMRIPLSRVEAALMRTLLASPGEIVTREALVVRAWPHSEPSRNAVDLAMRRLRQRVEPFGVMIRTARGRGYVVDDD